MALRRSSKEKPGASTFYPPSIPRAGGTDEVARSLLAILVLAGFIAIGFVTASTKPGSVAAALFETLCLAPLAVVVLREVHRAVRRLWISGARGPRAIRRFRRQLDALPEISHPRGA
jgi:hypothetical protein